MKSLSTHCLYETWELPEGPRRGAGWVLLLHKLLKTELCMDQGRNIGPKVGSGTATQPLTCHLQLALVGWVPQDLDEVPTMLQVTRFLPD